MPSANLCVKLVITCTTLDVISPQEKNANEHAHINRKLQIDDDKRNKPNNGGFLKERRKRQRTKQASVIDRSLRAFQINLLSTTNIN